MDWELFLSLLVGISLLFGVVVVLILAFLAQKGIGATLHDYWHTFFGKDDDLPKDTGQNPKLD